MPHVLVAGKIHESGIAVLKAAKSVTFEVVNEVSVASYAPLMGKADGLLVRTQAVGAEQIAAAKGLRIVSRHGVGYDAVDVSALNARKIPLAIVGDVNSRAVAEHTLMLMLAAARRCVSHDQALRGGGWQVRNGFETQELDGRVLLLIGFGRIGKRVGQLAQAFGMTVLAHDPYAKAEDAAVLNVELVADKAEGLQRADFVSLHVPALSGGAVIGAGELGVMKRSAIIVNAARGGLIDEAALDTALTEGRIFAAGLDVFAQEPPNADNGLLRNPRVVLSPHSAGLTEACAARMGIAAAQNVLDCFAGKLDARLVVNAKEIGFNA